MSAVWQILVIGRGRAGEGHRLSGDERIAIMRGRDAGLTAG